MARLIPLTDVKRRDAQIAADPTRKAPPVRMVSAAGATVHLERLIRSTDATSFEGLQRRFGDGAGIARALVESDPEIDLSLVGRRLGDAARIYLRKDGTILVTSHVLQVVRGPDGVEKTKSDFTDVEATVREDGTPLPWTGRLVPITEAVRRFAFTRQMQLRHVSGLTYEFLFEMAKTLDEGGKLLVVGAGPKGQQPLIFNTNGAPYRGFLEGRVDGNGYRLVLHLSNLELKSVTTVGA